MRWVAAPNKVIICDSEEDMKKIVAEYFPYIPLTQWKKEKAHDGHDNGRVYHYPQDF